MLDNKWAPPRVLVAVDLVILTLREAKLHVLLTERGIDPFRGTYALPGGFLNNDKEDLLAAAHRELQEETALDPENLHLEQLGAYGAPERDPRGRVISIAYLAISPELPEPSAGGDVTDAAWRLVDDVTSGRLTLAFDHHHILEEGIERARSKLERTTLATAFCGETFTIADLQRVYEAVWGVRLDPRNFYRKAQHAPGFIVPVEAGRRSTRGRPAKLFRAGPSKVLQPPITRPHATWGNR
ncbi:NUDIX hydrolase [Thermocrispum municipale]|uniref:NUDIX hydrolase n=1 Tax=Thermocrispum municipale TaxID=37926 RepID=UPI0004921CFD|nr:NUDIX domain-containing protein [Thermocrispum municipale]